MIEGISEAIKTAKDYDLGPSGAIWIAIFSVVATIAGKGATTAVKFVRDLLETSAQLRVQVKGQLDEANNRMEHLESRLREESVANLKLRHDLFDANHKMRELEEKLGIADSYIMELEAKVKRYESANRNKH